MEGKTFSAWCLVGIVMSLSLSAWAADPAPTATVINNNAAPLTHAPTATVLDNRAAPTTPNHTATVINPRTTTLVPPSPNSAKPAVVLTTPAGSMHHSTPLTPAKSATPKKKAHHSKGKVRHKVSKHKHSMKSKKHKQSKRHKATHRA
jgi:hypothetical protein